MLEANCQVLKLVFLKCLFFLWHLSSPISIMPRLRPLFLHRLFHKFNTPLLPILLRETRDVPSAVNELRWLREHVDERLSSQLTTCKERKLATSSLRQKRGRLLRSLCMRRGIWGEPLQYILGKEYFGPSRVEIEVCRGVLVPRCAANDGC